MVTLQREEMLTEEDFSSLEAYSRYVAEITLLLDTIEDLTCQNLKAKNDGIEYDEDCNPI
jgi:hypothetical protein